MNKAVSIYVRLCGDGSTDTATIDLERDPYWLDVGAENEPGTPGTAGLELQNFPKGAGASLPSSALSTSSLGGYSPTSVTVSGSVLTIVYAGVPAAAANAVVQVTLLF